MPKPQKRDRAYFERRLRAEFPAIYNDLLAGKYGTVNAAASAAGLVKSPSPLDHLKRAWRKASTAERKEFIKWVRGTASYSTPGTGLIRSAVTPDSYVEQWAIDRIYEVMDKRGIDQRDVSRELRAAKASLIDPDDQSLWRAIGSKRGKTRIGHDMIASLEQWLHDNRSV